MNVSSDEDRYKTFNLDSEEDVEVIIKGSLIKHIVGFMF